MRYQFSDLVDIPALGHLLDILYDISGIPSAIVDVDGRVLSGAGWQRICTDFHRRHPAAKAECLKSDSQIKEEILAGEPFVIYECPHGLIDSCCPVVIDGDHLANIFTGQMFHKPVEAKTLERFEQQAEKYGFDRKEYLAALAEVPVFSKDKHQKILNFLSLFAGYVTRIGLTNKRMLEQTEKDRAGERRFQLALESMGAFVSVIDLETCEILFLNQHARDVFGEVTGRVCWQVLQKDQQGPCAFCTGKFLLDSRGRPKNTYTWEFKNTLIGKWLHVTSRAIEWTDGRMVRLEIAVDISERKEMEIELRRSRDEWERSFNAIQDVVTIQDSEMRIVRVNKAACRLFKAKAEELVGRKCHELFRGASNPCADCPELKTLDDRGSHSGIIEHEKLAKIFWVSSAPIFDEQRKVKHLVHVAKDITEQRRLEDDLFQARKMEAIGILAGGIAHDFNNILSAILGYTDLAREDCRDEAKLSADLDQVAKAGNRARELVRQILTFSRKAGHNPQPLEPYLIVKESLKLLRASLPSSIRIQEQIDSESGSILVDPTKLHQVIVNLCTNSLHAMEEEKGVLAIGLARKDLTSAEVKGQTNVSPGSFVELSVSDTGQGINPEIIGRIFDPFFTTKSRDKGTGMGLAVIYGIVQECGGMIRVESEPGRGATFRVYFPRIDTSAEIFGQEMEELPVRGKEHILLVDDEAEIVKLQEIFLTRLGYKVTAITSSSEALEIFRADPAAYDLIITDQTMPEMTGDELAGKLLGLRPGVPIILCTGYSSRISEEEALTLGVKKFIMKPVRFQELSQAIRDILS